MTPNPALKKLGFSNSDRLVILHTDDIGMCHASVQAYIELVEFGLISSGAAMVPCSWFPKIASFCQNYPRADMGVHLTLTSEWDNYRWSPISTFDRSSGLIDGEGYFHRTSEDVQLLGNAEAARVELEAQYRKAFSAGIDITHVDTHMYALAHPKFIQVYISLAMKSKIPLFFPRLDAIGFERLGMEGDTVLLAVQAVHELEEQGMPLVDDLAEMNLTDPENRLDQAKQLLSQLSAGITHFILHPSIDTPELRAIAPDWKCRVADYQTFMNEDLRSYIKNIGVQIIGYRALKQLMM